MKFSSISPTNDVDHNSEKYACNKMPLLEFSQLPHQSQCAPALAGNLGNSWSTEISILSNCRSSYEAAVCLRRIQNLLEDINRDDRIKFCKVDFEVYITALQSQYHNNFLWTSDLRSIVLSINSTYFNESYLHDLSVDLLQEILMWIPIDEFLPILCISHDWYHIGTSNKIWKLFYQHRFVRLNPKSNLPPSFNGKYIQAFQQRLHDPHIGDKVEVAWRGKFRLEASDVYHGLAWWVAEVVDKHTSQNKYKIKYPGWDDRWDEWVPRSRLRWQVETNEVVQITVDSAVEIWCCGATVPGAWLESKVTQISYTHSLVVDHNSAATSSTTSTSVAGVTAAGDAVVSIVSGGGSNTEANSNNTNNATTPLIGMASTEGVPVMYCVGGVLSSGDLWVPRDRLRLVKHENQLFDESRVDVHTLSSPRSTHRGDSFVGNHTHNNNAHGGEDGHHTPNGSHSSSSSSSLLHRWSSSPSSLRSSFIGLTFRSMNGSSGSSNSSSGANSTSTSPTQSTRTSRMTTPRSPQLSPRSSQQNGSISSSTSTSAAPMLTMSHSQSSQQTWRNSHTTIVGDHNNNSSMHIHAHTQHQHVNANVTQPIPPFMQTVSASAAVAAAAVINSSSSSSSNTSSRTNTPRNNSPRLLTQQESAEAACVIM